MAFQFTVGSPKARERKVWAWIPWTSRVEQEEVITSLKKQMTLLTIPLKGPIPRVTYYAVFQFGVGSPKARESKWPGLPGWGPSSHRHKRLQMLEIQITNLGRIAGRVIMFSVRENPLYWGKLSNKNDNNYNYNYVGITVDYLSIMYFRYQEYQWNP